jgi:bacillithiol system protein YtxJ
MSLFSPYSSSYDFEKVNWKNLTTLSELEAALEQSHQHPVVIFKHSTSCGTSAAAKDRLYAGWNLGDQAQFYYLDLIRYRAVSNEIAARLGVVHHSPQVIVVKNGKAVYDASHFRIAVDAIQKAL